MATTDKGRRKQFANRTVRKSVTRAASPRAVSGGGKKVRLWSPSRPERPEVDPLYLEVRQLLERDKRSVWAKANASGVSTTTIYNWQRHKTKRPSGVCLQMVAAAMGKRIRLE